MGSVSFLGILSQLFVSSGLSQDTQDLLVLYHAQTWIDWESGTQGVSGPVWRWTQFVRILRGCAHAISILCLEHSWSRAQERFIQVGQPYISITHVACIRGVLYQHVECGTLTCRIQIRIDISIRISTYFCNNHNSLFQTNWLLYTLVLSVSWHSEERL